MSTKSKTALIIICTLILGMVLGALGSGAIMRHQLRPFGGPPTTERMVELFDRMIDLDDSQRDTVETILKHHAERFIEMNERHWNEMQPFMDSLKIQLDQVLTEEQIRKLEQADKRAHDMFGKPRFFGPRPMPGDRPPPWGDSSRADSL